MKQYMGPSSFTENGPVNVMLEAETNLNRNIAFEESLATKQELIQTYFEVVRSINLNTPRIPSELSLTEQRLLRPIRQR